MRRAKYLVPLLAGLLACGGREASGPLEVHEQTLVDGGISYRAEAVIMESFPVQVRLNVHITNGKGNAVKLTFPDGCLVQLRLFRDAARSDEVQHAAQYGCTMALVPVTIEPGETQTISTPTMSAAEILGNKLPNGTYYLSAEIRPNWKTQFIPAGEAELAQ